MKIFTSIDLLLFKFTLICSAHSSQSQSSTSNFLSLERGQGLLFGLLTCTVLPHFSRILKKCQTKLWTIYYIFCSVSIDLDMHVYLSALTVSAKKGLILFNCADSSFFSENNLEVKGKKRSDKLHTSEYCTPVHGMRPNFKLFKTLLSFGLKTQNMQSK